MKRKAASRPASEQTANKMSSSKGKQVAGTPVDSDQWAHEVLRATAPSHKVCRGVIFPLAWPQLHRHQILWRNLSHPPLSSSGVIPVPFCVPCSPHVQAVRQMHALLCYADRSSLHRS